MASSGKRKTTMAKLTRERRLRERRLEKQERKDARRRNAGLSEDQPTDLAAADAQGVEPDERHDVDETLSVDDSGTEPGNV
jgi:hypothetical protein